MGKHTPSEKKQKRTVFETLTEAEQDHWLDCPDADLPLRSAGFLLDVIFFSIASSGIHHLSGAVLSLHNAVASSLTEPLSSFIPLLILYLSWSLKTIAGFLYFVWTVSRFGGTPAKLLLGLRVVDSSHGGKLTLGQAVLREVVGKFLFGWFMAFTITGVATGQIRAFQDWLAKSVVKKVHG
jgi:uncharacterized RDD family membrane protein YckC